MHEVAPDCPSVELECHACGAVLVTGSYTEETYPVSKERDGAPTSILVCNRCGLGVAHPMLSDDFLKNLYEGESPEFWNVKALPPLMPRQYPVPYGLAKARWALIEPHLSSMEKKSLTIVDIGAGFGFFGVLASQSLNLATLKYIAVEPDESLHARILEMWKALNLRSSIEVLSHLEDVGDQADILVLSHVLEHVPDPLCFLETVLSHLKDGGMLFIDVPHRDQRFKPDVFPHLYFYTPESLVLILEKSGLEALDVDAWGCDWKDSPFFEKKKNKMFHFIDRLTGRMARYLPIVVSSEYFSNRYAMARRSSNGTWIRALARKNN